MRVLALDTTRASGSVALVEDGQIVAEGIGDARRSHAERLPTDLMNLLAARGLSAAAVDLFAVAAGPGSFTGLRIGIATMQGLAFVVGRRIVPISLLEALAQSASDALPDGVMVGAWIDAHRGEVFSALYRIEGAAPFDPGRVLEIDPPAVGSPAHVLERWRPHAHAIRAVAGDGAVLYAEALQKNLPNAEGMAPPSLAGIIGLMASARVGAAVDPAGVQPLYIRRPDAELARDGANSSPWFPGRSNG